ncbi:unnamed protein product, partial [Rotaria sp. Silwood2]
MNSINICEYETECSKIAYFSCHHCPKSLCLEHLNQHNTLNIIRVQELSNELDGFVNHVSNLDTRKTFQNAHNKLDAWKEQISDDIESIYKLHLNELSCLEKELNQHLNIIKEYVRLKLLDLGTQLLTVQRIDEISQRVQLLPIEYDLNQLRQFFESVRCEQNINIKNISIDALINACNVFSYRQTLSNRIVHFRCISCFNDTSLYISYCTSGTCIELWKYSHDNGNDIYLNECFKHWDCLTNDKNEWISHMNTISNLHIGLLICKGSSIYRRFELRDENLNLVKIIQLDNDYV